MKIDSIDAKILAILQSNGRTSNAEIGRRIGLTASAVHERVRKLERSGVIRSYAAVLDHEAMDKTLLAYVYIRLRPHRLARQLARELSTVAGVQEVAHLAGEECFMVKVRCNGTGELEDIIYALNELEGVIGTRTVIALGSVIEHPSLPIQPPGGEHE